MLAVTRIKDVPLVWWGQQRPRGINFPMRRQTNYTNSTVSTKIKVFLVSLNMPKVKEQKYFFCIVLVFQHNFSFSLLTKLIQMFSQINVCPNYSMDLISILVDNGCPGLTIMLFIKYNDKSKYICNNFSLTWSIKLKEGKHTRV